MQITTTNVELTIDGFPLRFFNYGTHFSPPGKTTWLPLCVIWMNRCG